MRVLLTRPQGKAKALAKQLERMVEFVAVQSVIEINDGPDISEVVNCIAQKPQMLIFVSVNAVTYLQKALAEAQIADDVTEACQLVAVGQSTAKALNDWLKRPVITPEIENSEGLLQVELLQKESVTNKQVAIVRGVGGRELLAEQLKVRGAIVNYWQMYQRQAITGCGESWYQQWQTWQIDTLVVTSVAIVEAIIEALPQNAKSWWQKLNWVCASARIAAAIEQLDVPKKQIYVANGAHDAAILQQIKIIDEDV